MGEQLGVLHQRSAAAPLQFLCDFQVHRRPRVAQQAIVDRVAQQRVLEVAFLGSFVADDEAGRLQGVNGGDLEMGAAERGNEQGREASAEHRGHLQERARLGRQLVDARGKHRLNGCWQGAADSSGVEPNLGADARRARHARRDNWPSLRRRGGCLPRLRRSDRRSHAATAPRPSAPWRCERTRARSAASPST